MATEHFNCMIHYCLLHVAFSKCVSVCVCVRVRVCMCVYVGGWKYPKISSETSCHSALRNVVSFWSFHCQAPLFGLEDTEEDRIEWRGCSSPTPSYKGQCLRFLPSKLKMSWSVTDIDNFRDGLRLQKTSKDMMLLAIPGHWMEKLCTRVDFVV